MKSLFFTGYLLVILVVKVDAQFFLSPSSKVETPNEYYLQVKQFNEFVDRFNYLSDWKGQKITPEFEAKYSRADYLGYLFNLSDSRLSNTTDSTYIKLCNEFIKQATATPPLTISLYGGHVTAISMVNVKYKGVNQKVKIQFVPEVLNDRSAKWVVQKVETDIFKSLSDSLTHYFMAPNSHETSFINLKRIEALSNPVFFFGHELNSDPTILFMTEIANGHLKIENIESVKYQINLSSWRLTVEEFSRTTTNSGWLISNLEKLE